MTNHRSRFDWKKSRAEETIRKREWYMHKKSIMFMIRSHFPRELRHEFGSSKLAWYGQIFPTFYSIESNWWFSYLIKLKTNRFLKSAFPIKGLNCRVWSVWPWSGLWVSLGFLLSYLQMNKMSSTFQTQIYYLAIKSKQVPEHSWVLIGDN